MGMFSPLMATATKAAGAKSLSPLTSLLGTKGGMVGAAAMGLGTLGQLAHGKHTRKLNRIPRGHMGNTSGRLGEFMPRSMGGSA